MSVSAGKAAARSAARQRVMKLQQAAREREQRIQDHLVAVIGLQAAEEEALTQAREAEVSIGNFLRLLREGERLTVEEVAGLCEIPVERARGYMRAAGE